MDKHFFIGAGTAASLFALIFGPQLLKWDRENTIAVLRTQLKVVKTKAEKDSIRASLRKLGVEEPRKPLKK